MAEYDLVQYIKATPAINPASLADPVTGTSIDTKGYESVTFVVLSGAIGAGTIDFKIEHADDNGSGSPGSWSDAGTDDKIGTYPSFVATTNNNQAKVVGYRGKKRWVRLTNIETSAWTTAIHGAVCILGNPTRVPAA